MLRRMLAGGCRRTSLSVVIVTLGLIQIACWSLTASVQTPQPSSIVEEETPARPPIPVNTPTRAGDPVLLPRNLLRPAVSVPMPLFGVESHKVDAARAGQIQAAGARLVRRNALLWSAVEPGKGERNWGAVAELEAELALLGSQGFQVILIVRGTPEWAQAIPGYSCSAVKADEFEAFARFLAEAAARYSAPPFNVRYWELGNEPDVDPALIAPNSPYGCWGDPQDEYYGGRHYARMLKAVYPAMKAAAPQAQVLIGGLLLDCDPAHPQENNDCRSARFLEGILKAGGGNFFDIANFHGYPPYIGSLAMDEGGPSWGSRGGVVLGKLAYLRELLAVYGLEKPVMHTESALVCPDWSQDYCNPPGSDFYEAQADYLVILFVRNWAAGVAGTVWYHFEGPGWRYVGLLDEADQPGPAYRAMQYLTRELSGAVYTGPVIDGPSMRGISFSTPEKFILVLWSPDVQPDLVLLPPGVLGVFDKYGEPVPLDGNTIRVLSPVYVELLP